MSVGDSSMNALYRVLMTPGDVTRGRTRDQKGLKGGTLTTHPSGASIFIDLSKSLGSDSQPTTTTMDRDNSDNNVDDNNTHWHLNDNEMEILLAKIVVRPHLGARCDSARSAPNVSLMVP
jgi:hypothetical protein